jgi:hypothetical protein
VDPTTTALSAEAPDVILVPELTPEVRRLCELRTLMRAAKRDRRPLAERREELVIGTSADREGFLLGDFICSPMGEP